MFKILQIGKFEAYLICKFKVPYGLYWYEQDDGTFIGIDNTTGEAITEVFSSFEFVIDWLEGKFEIEDFETWKQKMMTRK